MNKARLLKLADLLETDANKKTGIKFDMGTWGETAGKNPKVSCGTRACAMGLAAISGVFKRQGLNYYVDYYEVFNTADVMIGFGRDKICGGFDAAMKLFDIDEDASQFLFNDASYEKYQQTGKRAELAVAKRIRDFVAGKVEP